MISAERIAIIAAAAIVIALGAYLVSGPLLGGDGEEVSQAPQAAGATAGGARGGAAEAEEDEAGPRWEQFTRVSDTEIARPVVRTQATRDPFERAYARARLAALGLRLEGVAPGEAPLAMISGRIVRLGDTLDVFRVVAIESTRVVLEGPAGVLVELVPQHEAPPERDTEAAEGGAAGRPALLPGALPPGAAPGILGTRRSDLPTPGSPGRRSGRSGSAAGRPPDTGSGLPSIRGLRGGRGSGAGGGRSGASSPASRGGRSGDARRPGSGGEAARTPGR